jgi:AcrR family transcriptional regulator
LGAGGPGILGLWARRRARERAIVATTRALIDERGRRDAAVDEIARAARMSKALIYRSFDSKEEIFVLAVVDYLAELEARGAELPDTPDPVAALRRVCERYVGFCLDYPAFLDCGLALMQRPASELRELVSGAVLFRLGRARRVRDRRPRFPGQPALHAGARLDASRARRRRRARVRTRRRGDLRSRSRAGA